MSYVNVVLPNSKLLYGTDIGLEQIGFEYEVRL